MRVIHESQVLREPSTLSALWHADETFALLPNKMAVVENWVRKAMALVPDEFDQHHFGLLTSGSTGEPKLVIGSRRRAEALASAIHERQRNDLAVETICLLPLSYSFAFVNQWVWSRVYQRRLLTSAGFSDPQSLKAALNSARDSMLCMVGAQVPLLFQFFPNASFPGVVRLHFAGGRFPQERLEELATLFPNAKIFNNYGCAEAMPRLTIRGAHDADDAANVGKPLAGIEVRAPEGRLEFRSPYSARLIVEGGIAHTVTPDEWIPTGDLGNVADDASVRLTGRAGDVYKRFGEKVSLAQIMTAIQRTWPRGAAFYRTQDHLGESAHVLVLAPAPSDAEMRALLAEFRASFTRPHWPLRIESTDTIPLLSNGKPDVQKLADDAVRFHVHWQQRY